jgi:hypothetical protein
MSGPYAAAIDEVRQARSELIDWSMALRAACLAALIGVVPPSCLPGALTGGVVGGLALLVIPVLTLGVVSVYHRSRPRRMVSPAIGVRIGAMLGLIMGALIALVTGVSGFILRYGYHSHAMADKIEQASDQMMVQLSAAGPIPRELLNFFRSPEFHAGTFILGHVISLLLLVAIGSICGWMAGALLRARRQRNIG